MRQGVLARNTRSRSQKCTRTADTCRRSPPPPLPCLWVVPYAGRNPPARPECLEPPAQHGHRTPSPGGEHSAATPHRTLDWRDCGDGWIAPFPIGTSSYFLGDTHWCQVKLLDLGPSERRISVRLGKTQCTHACCIPVIRGHPASHHQLIAANLSKSPHMTGNDLAGLPLVVGDSSISSPLCISQHQTVT